MVADAEKYKVEDEAVKQRIEKKNVLENYCFQMKSQLDDEAMGGKFSQEDKLTI